MSFQCRCFTIKLHPHSKALHRRGHRESNHGTAAWDRSISSLRNIKRIYRARVNQLCRQGRLTTLNRYRGDTGVLQHAVGDFKPELLIQVGFNTTSVSTDSSTNLVTSYGECESDADSERQTGYDPATLTLATSRSTN